MAGVVELTRVPSGVLKTKALRKLRDLPPFSPILNRLMATLAGDNVSFAKLGDLIEKDTLVAGNILHLVNSALYARRGTVNSVRHALSLMGVDKVRNAVLGMSLARMWSKIAVPRSWSMGRFDTHSAAVAILSDLLAQRLPVEYPEGAFVAGLLHDLGQLLIAAALPDEFERIDNSDRIECERRILGFTHAELSAEALAVWNLPEEIQIAVRDHHESQVEGIPLCRIVRAADNYVNSTGTSIADQGHANDGSIITCLGLEAPELDDVLKEFRTEFDSMLNYFRPC